jgi:hypothetical protein
LFRASKARIVSTRKACSLPIFHILLPADRSTYWNSHACALDLWAKKPDYARAMHWMQPSTDDKTRLFSCVSPETTAAARTAANGQAMIPISPYRYALDPFKPCRV